MKVSVIIPVYNTEKYIAKCLDSVIGQTYDDLEIIVVDDGSTDGSYAICLGYEKKDPRITVFRQENSGQAVARNSALDNMHGDYVLFVDSDDRILPGTVEKLVSAVKKNNADILQFGIIVDNDITETYRAPETKEYKSKEEMFESFIKPGGITQTLCDKFFSASLFDGLRFPEMRKNEDYYILVDLLRKCSKYAVTDECFYIQYIRNNSTERAVFSEKDLCGIKCAAHLRDIILKEMPSLSGDVTSLEVDWIAAVTAKMIRTHKYKENKELYEKLRGELSEKVAEVGPEKCSPCTVFIYSHKTPYVVAKYYFEGVRERIVGFFKSIVKSAVRICKKRRT